MNEHTLLRIIGKEEAKLTRQLKAVEETQAHIQLLHDQLNAVRSQTDAFAPKTDTKK